MKYTYEVTIRGDSLHGDGDKVVGKYYSKREAMNCFTEYAMQGFIVEVHEVNYFLSEKYIKLIASNKPEYNEDYY